MPVVALSRHFEFPPVQEADEDGLLVIGGAVFPEKIIEAYKKGIFPWYSEGEPVLWWSPDPRFVLFPEELHISNSMKKLFRQKTFSFTMDKDFENVIAHCRYIKREGQSGTWITDEMEATYTQLFHQGHAHSGEAWLEGELAGGIYGVRIGNMFFAESMFSKFPNASKFALISLVQQLEYSGVKLVDCQVYSRHVESLGARLISRENYLQLLNQNID